MNVETLPGNDLSLSLTIWSITIAILFVIMVIGMYRSIKFTLASRREMTSRIRRLLLGDMLARLNIPLKDYYRNTSDLDKERHIRKCIHCPDPEQCENMLLGEDIDPHTFCPNYRELSNLKSEHRCYPKTNSYPPVGNTPESLV